MSRLAVAEEGLVVDPRLQALEVEPARGLGRQRPARRTGRRFALVLVRPVALVAVAALAFAIFRAGVAVGILVATIVIAIERHLVEARVVIGIPSMSGLPELVRAVVGVAVVSVLDLVSPVDGPLKNVVGIVVREVSAVVEQRLSIGDGVVVARRGARRRGARRSHAGSAKTINIKHT